jgi:hypothetical protein
MYTHTHTTRRSGIQLVGVYMFQKMRGERFCATMLGVGSKCMAAVGYSSRADFLRAWVAFTPGARVYMVNERVCSLLC